MVKTVNRSLFSGYLWKGKPFRKMVINGESLMESNIIDVDV